MPTWLILDDDEDIPVMLSLMFQSMGIDGKAFQRGENMLDWVEDVVKSSKDNEQPELALIDIRLSGLLSGIDAAARLRRIPGLQDIAIVLMTAYRINADDERRIISLSSADLLLVKPLPRRDELIKRLNEVIKARQSGNDQP